MILDFLRQIGREFGLLPPLFADSSTFRSKPENAKAIGWGRLGGRWFTLAPLVDVSTPEGLTASLACPSDAERALRSYGARLPTSAEIELLSSSGFRISPVTLPTAEMRPPRAPGESDRAYAIRCYAPMSTIGWKRVHDVRARRLLAPWDRTTPVANFGKHPYRNGPSAPPVGRCYLRGWWDGSRFIQEGVPDGTPGPHMDGQFDYATTTIGVYDGDVPPPYDSEARAAFLAQIPEHA